MPLMIFQLYGYPEELVPFLISTKKESRNYPEIEIPDSIFFETEAVINEFLLFYKTEKDHEKKGYHHMMFPLNPILYYEGEKVKNIIDCTHFGWYELWKKAKTETVLKERLQVVQLLEQNKIIEVNYNPPAHKDIEQYFILSIKPIPNVEALNIFYYRLTEMTQMIEVEMSDAEERDILKNQLPNPLIGQLREQLDIGYWIDYHIDGKIVLNGKYIIAHPNFDTENDKFFDYVSKKPKQKITLEELTKNIGRPERNLSKIIYNLGFIGELKKLFFPRVSNNSVLFNNQITQKELFGLGINIPELEKQISLLKSL
jgi:hypothetical protein